MTYDQVVILAILGGVFALFVKGPWRYDVVAVVALMSGLLSGVIPAANAFEGFSHPATITVAAVLIISRGLSNSGAIGWVASRLIPEFRTASGHIGSFSTMAAGLSALMNNVGALALLMPVALESAARSKRAVAIILMPLAFASILGGMITLIGTPPNIIIASYRAQTSGVAFGMFDFSPVGGILALVGVIFVALVGWRLIPRSRRTTLSRNDLFDIEDYLTEARLADDSPLIDRRVRDLDDEADSYDVSILGLIRGNRRLPGAARREVLKAGDILIVEANPKQLDSFCSALGLSLVGVDEPASALLSSDDLVLSEVVVAPGSRLENRIARDMRLSSRFGINLIAVSRQGKPFRNRLSAFCFRAGDVLLIRGDAERLPATAATLGLLPLEKRDLRIGKPRQAGIAVAIFVAAIASATLGLLPLTVALLGAVTAMVILNIVPVREIYQAVEWPVVVLLGAMIPLGSAFESTGTTGLVADAITTATAGMPAIVVLGLVLVVTMTVSDIMNNAATAVIMAPIAVATAGRLGVNSDPFLMAVAVGASCAFLTPIGHQNNTLVMGPGGYHFGDYWRMGLPLEAIIVALGVPLIAFFWPL